MIPNFLLPPLFSSLLDIIPLFHSLRWTQFVPINHSVPVVAWRTHFSAFIPYLLRTYTIGVFRKNMATKRKAGPGANKGRPMKKRTATTAGRGAEGEISAAGNGRTHNSQSVRPPMSPRAIFTSQFLSCCRLRIHNHCALSMTSC